MLSQLHRYHAKWRYHKNIVELQTIGNELGYHLHQHGPLFRAILFLGCRLGEVLRLSASIEPGRTGEHTSVVRAMQIVTMHHPAFVGNFISNTEHWIYAATMDP